MHDIGKIIARLACAALTAGALFAAGCGSSGDDGGDKKPEPKPEPKPTGHTPCTPRALENTGDAAPERAREGEPVTLRVGKTKLTLEVAETARPKKIPIRFGDRPAFRAPRDAMLVAVTYRVANGGPGTAKPSEHVNSQLRLDVGGKQYPYAAKLPCGLPLTASWALRDDDGVNPAKTLKPGDEATTAVVFIVPKHGRRAALSLEASGQVRIRLSTAG